MIKQNHLWTEEEIAGNIDYIADQEEVIKNNQWHTLFESPQWILLNPAEEVVQFHLKYLGSPSRQVSERCKLTGNKMHDLGCGGGRHLLYFAELGFDVCGSDLSSNAIEFTQQELDRRHLRARLDLCPMTELPYEDAEFDVTISRAVINHTTLQGMKKVIHEVARTTKPGGLFFVTLSSDRCSDWRQGEEIQEDITYVPTEGPEKGLVHTYFNAANASALLEPFFRIEETYLYEHAALMPSAPGATDPGQYFGSEYVVIGVRRG